jgi:hypothetical protein
MRWRKLFRFFLRGWGTWVSEKRKQADETKKRKEKKGPRFSLSLSLLLFLLSSQHAPVRDPPAGQDQNLLLVAELGKAVCPDGHRDGLLGAVSVDKGGRWGLGFRRGLAALWRPSRSVVGVVFSRRRRRRRRRGRRSGMLLLPLGSGLNRGFLLLALGHLESVLELSGLKERGSGLREGKGTRRNALTEKRMGGSLRGERGPSRCGRRSPVLIAALSVGAAL